MCVFNAVSPGAMLDCHVMRRTNGDILLLRGHPICRKWLRTSLSKAGGDGKVDKHHKGSRQGSK